MKRFDGLEKKFDHKFKKLECILTTESTKEVLMLGLYQHCSTCMLLVASVFCHN